ncbi:MAG TPA: 50S ribosomal protein L4 [Thermoplasmata archaeon]|jgi:large subunit ribosomal protein L4e|nr:50S ribosomal protein L4 [Thermoplasmata archaeon]
MAKKAAKPEPKKARKAPAPDLAPLHVHLYDVSGKVAGTVELPPVFAQEIRTDLIRRAVTAFAANRRQPYGAAPRAGMRHSVRWAGKGQGVSRVPRIRGTMIGAQAPGTVGGRAAHPPVVDRIWAKKVNVKERRLARGAALAAIHDPRLVSARGHRFAAGTTVPVVVQDALEEIETASDAIEFLERIGVYDDVLRSKDGRHVRAGRGKMRARRYRQPRGPLLVVRNAAKARQGFGNLAGVEIVTPNGLNAEVLAPGGDPGRLTIFSAGALEALRGW